jgi:hypothetical protein
MFTFKSLVSEDVFLMFRHGTVERRVFCHCKTLLAAALIFSSGASIAQQYSVLARSNDGSNTAAFQLPDKAYLDGSFLSLSNTGQVVTGIPRVANGQPDLRYWLYDQGVGTVVLSTDAQTDLGAPTWSAGSIYYSRRGQSTAAGIYRLNPSSLTSELIVAAPSGVASFGFVRPNSAGVITTNLSLTTSASAFDSVTRFSPGASPQILISTAPNTAGVAYLGIYAANSNRVGDVVVAVARPSGVIPDFRPDQILRLNVGQTVATVVAENDELIPGNGITRFDTTPQINDAGDVAYATENASGARTVWLLRSGAGAPTRVAAMVGAGGDLLDIRAQSFALNGSGQITFMGRDGAGYGLMFFDGRSVRKILSRGQVIPSDLGPARLDSSSPASYALEGIPAINDRGAVLVVGNLLAPLPAVTPYGRALILIDTDVIFSNGFER